jgi:hypothetical protein
VHLPRRVSSAVWSKKQKAFDHFPRLKGKIEGSTRYLFTASQKTESVSPSLSLAQQFAAAITTADFDEDEKQVFWLRSRSTGLALPYFNTVAP